MSEEVKHPLEALNAVKPLELYQPGNIDKVLEKIRMEVSGKAFDITTKKGRDEVASLAYKISRSKTFLDDVGKKLGEDAKKTLDAINAERRKVKDSLDALRDEVRKPLTDWEAAEESRIKGHTDAIEHIKNLGSTAELSWMSMTMDQLSNGREQVQTLTRNWEEFEGPAKEASEIALSKINLAITNLEQYQAQQAEIARLRAEAEERARKENEERIAREAADKARKEAEEAAAKEQERLKQQAEDERLKSERAAAESKAREEAAIREKEEAERKLKEAEAKAEREKQEAIERERQRVENERIAKEKAEREAAERMAKSEETHRAIVSAIVQEMNFEEVPVKHLVSAIAAGRIPNLKIEY